MSNDKSASKDSKGMYGFDPTGLERAAKAAKILDNSPNSKNAFELALKEEETKQLQTKMNLKNIDHSNRQQRMSYEAKLAKEKAEYEDLLARERIEFRLQKEKEAKELALRETEESIKRQEEYRKQTIKFENEMLLQREKEKMIQQFELQAHMERKNMDLVEKKIRITEQEKRITANQLASTGIDLIGKGIKDFILDKQMFSKVLFGLTGAYITIYGFKSIFNLSFKLIERKLIIPKLTKETSRLSYKEFYKIPYKKLIQPRYLKLYGFIKGKTQEELINEKIFEGISFSKELNNDLNIISTSIVNKQMHNTPFRNLLFYGSPGNGKTLFAKKLAQNCGLDYAIMTGADVLPLGSSAVTELNKLFDWAETSKKGLLLFIDESDAFLKRRTNDEVLSENLRSVINCFLYRTGTPSKKFFVIMATNAPQLLDEAVQNRIDELVFFDKPNGEQREKILTYYMDKYIKNNYLRDNKNLLLTLYDELRVILKFKVFKNAEIKYTESDIHDLSLKTEGFSSRELNKLVVLIHDIAFNSSNPLVDNKIIIDAYWKFTYQRKTKDEWNSKQTEYFNKIHH